MNGGRRDEERKRKKEQTPGTMSACGSVDK
jgi:hypothetical protein